MTTITWLAGVSVLRPESLSISADKIAAGAITADKLVIEPEASLPWPEPSFSGFSRSQIQVWVEDRLVGYLEGDLRLGYGKINEFRDDYGIMRPVKVREAELSRFELLSRDDEVRVIAEFCEKKHVGADFQRIDSHHKDSILFRWNTIEVCLEEYEELIFDLDSFDPA